MSEVDVPARGETEAERLTRELRGWEESFALYDRASRRAQAYWRGATGQTEVIPDRAKMLDWFIAERERLLKELHP